MNIIVLVKAVPDSEARISLRPGVLALQIEEKNELNYFDGLAVEEAVRTKELPSGGTVTAVTLGPRRALEAARKAVAMGADAAVHVEEADEPFPDPLRTARILAACIGSLGFDLIWCGRKAADDDSALVGPMVAELLGIPHVSAVVKAALVDEGKALVVTRDLEGGQEAVRCPLPALLTAQKGLNEPRVPSIQGVMRGMKLQPRKVEPAGLGLSPEAIGSAARGWRVVGIAEPPKRPPMRVVEGPDPAAKARELVRILREEIRVL
jgi:electron transfer flavoprotein beta subunit